MKIILKPHSGLANRIRVMVSGIGLSKELGIPIKIVWEKDNGLNCLYSDLFKPNSVARVTEFDFRSYLIQLCMGKPRLLKLIGKCFRIGFMMFDKDMHAFVWKSGTNFINPEIIKSIGSGDVYINLCNEFYFKRENLQYFSPTDRLQADIQQIVSRFSKNTVGLHIRRTDHKQAIQESPLEAFVTKIEDEIKQDSSVAFYLASDDGKVKDMLIERFGNRILFSKIELTRGNADGMHGAMIDLYALASTRKIYGSFFSSYSDIAARIGDIPLVVVT